MGRPASTWRRPTKRTEAAIDEKTGRVTVVRQCPKKTDGRSPLSERLRPAKGLKHLAGRKVRPRGTGPFPTETSPSSPTPTLARPSSPPRCRPLSRSGFSAPSPVCSCATVLLWSKSSSPSTPAPIMRSHPSARPACDCSSLHHTSSGSRAAEALRGNPSSVFAAVPEAHL